jgi:hypothetical protein
MGFNPGCHSGKPVTNRLTYGMASSLFVPNMLFQHPVLKYSQSLLPIMSEIKFHTHTEPQARYILIASFSTANMKAEDSGWNGSKH